MEPYRKCLVSTEEALDTGDLSTRDREDVVQLILERDVLETMGVGGGARCGTGALPWSGIRSKGRARDSRPAV